MEWLFGENADPQTRQKAILVTITALVTAGSVLGTSYYFSQKLAKIEAEAQRRAREELLRHEVRYNPFLVFMQRTSVERVEYMYNL